MGSVRLPPTIIAVTRSSRVPLDSAADQLLADTCARMRGGLTLGAHDDEYPAFENKSGPHGDTVTRAVDEIHERMQKLVELEKSDVSERRDQYVRLRTLECEHLLADSVEHIVYHMASAIHPRIGVKHLIDEYKRVAETCSSRLDEYRNENDFHERKHAHHRDEVHRKREADRKTVRDAGGSDVYEYDDEEEEEEEEDSDVSEDGAGGGGGGGSTRGPGSSAAGRSPSPTVRRVDPPPPKMPRVTGKGKGKGGRVKKGGGAAITA
jgi:hypothetical protein